MNVDVVIGSALSVSRLARFGLAADAIVVGSPAQAVEQLVKAKFAGQVARLRLFDMVYSPGARLETVHIARLRGVFQPGGALEVFRLDESPPRSTGANTGATPTIGVPTASGGFGQFGGVGFQGGFNVGRLNAPSSGSPGPSPLNSVHLTQLLGVPVQVTRI